MSTPLGTTVTLRLSVRSSTQRATGSDTAMTESAASKARRAMASAPTRSASTRCCACSSTSGELTSRTPGTSKARAQVIAASDHSE
ncbi:hypothetical protein ASJ30_06360 [Janibacter indicus]|uniref:Uncharacterized protein n=1 Tax=Janibacter indicus TaxID=857417 RepID=A0A1L3MFV3_9MICO|nr:hypothetical protein [Janibacter indicus]APH01212.1 hypothetical protein ASJ30_06360 [Janibacter indicus]